MAQGASHFAVAIGDSVVAFTDCWSVQFDGVVFVLGAHYAAWSSGEAVVAFPVFVSALAEAYDSEKVEVVRVDALNFGFLSDIVAVQSLEASSHILLHLSLS